MSAGPATSMQEDPAQSFGKKLETVTKASVIAVALLYGLGLLVTNEYLISIGVSDFTSVRPKYILTGSWFVFLIAVCSLPILFLFATRDHSRKDKVFAVIFGVFLGCGLVVLALKMLRVEPGLKETWKPLTMLLFSSFAIYGQTWTVRRISAAPAAISLAAIVLFGCVGGTVMTFIVAKGIYPKVPEALGGGKPLSGRIILNKEATEFWLEAGVEKSDPSKKSDDTFQDTPRSRSAKILYQDEHVMVIEVQTSRTTPRLGESGRVNSTNTRTMLLNKSLVDGVIIDSTWKY